MKNPFPIIQLELNIILLIVYCNVDCSKKDTFLYILCVVFFNILILLASSIFKDNMKRTKVDSKEGENKSCVEKINLLKD